MRVALAIALLAATSLVGCTRIDTGDTAPSADQTAPRSDMADRTSPTTDTAAPSTDRTDNTAAAPDNTAVNRRDAQLDTKLPTDQGENEQDRNMTAEIRKRITDTENLSINARNAKIITAGGKVTLRGPVNSASERDTLEKIARDVAGEDNVDNQLEVATDSANPTNP